MATTLDNWNPPRLEKPDYYDTVKFVYKHLEFHISEDEAYTILNAFIGKWDESAGQVIHEVTDKWSGSQTISGPVLVIPYRKQEIIDHGKDGKEIKEHIEKAFFLPEQLDIKGTVNPELLHRGIFDAVVYESALQIKSTFSKPDIRVKFTRFVDWVDNPPNLHVKIN